MKNLIDESIIVLKGVALVDSYYILNRDHFLLLLRAKMESNILKVSITHLMCVFVRAALMEFFIQQIT